MRNIRLTIGYDGTDFHGFQRQRNAITIQEELENAIERVTKKFSELVGCGRTDAGVHALNYVCNFKTECGIPAEKVPLALNSYLPNSIRVTHACESDTAFNARFDVKKKTYVYKIYNNPISDPFLTRYSLWIPQKLDVKLMKKAAKHFIGEHDFKAFCSADTTVASTVRTIYSLEIAENKGLIEIYVEGNGFLYNMVRIIAGTLIYVGLGKLKPDDIKEIIASKERKNAGVTAKPCGLYLYKVDY